jgi:hypothetical protein
MAVQMYPAQWIVAELELKFPGLRAHLAWIPIFFFYGDLWTLNSTPIKSILERNSDIELKILQVK